LEVITEDVLKKLNELRQQGVILIGDEFTTPALMLDHRLKSVNRKTNDPLGSKAELQKLGREIASVLSKHVTVNASASNQDLVVRQRGSNSADYVFVVNDKRTFGDYIGQWKLVPEKGLANSGSVTVNHTAAAAYDLVLHQAIKLNKQKDSCSFDVHLPPGGGSLVLLLEKSIEQLQLTVPENIARGQAFSIEAAICSADGNPIDAILPVELIISAPNGIRLPGSGYYAAVNGKLSVPEVMAPNAATGTAQVMIRCLASGKTTQRSFTIR